MQLSKPETGIGTMLLTKPQNLPGFLQFLVTNHVYLLIIYDFMINSTGNINS